MLDTPAPPATPDIALPWFMPSAETMAEQERILAGRFFLIRTGGNGLRWRCSPKKGGCGGYHRYLTLRCVEQPFSGLTRGLYAYWRTIGAQGMQNHLTLRERARFDALTDMFGGLPDLADAHPLTVRSLGIDERDADLGALTFTATQLTASALGVVEPIDRERAARLARRINLRGIKPAFILPGVHNGD